MHNHLHNMHSHYHLRLIKNEIQEVYLNLTIQSFAISLISVFVPIYLLQVGFSLNQALIFMMVELGTLSFFSPFAAMLARRYGFKHIILYRVPLMIIYFAGLYLVDYIKPAIYLIALAGGIAGSVYWVSLHALFAKYSDKIKRGAQTGKLVSLPNISAMLGPMIGGFIAVAFGFHILFIASMLLLFASTIPLFFTDDMKPHVKKFSLKAMFSRKHSKFIIRFAAQGIIATAGAILWPVFVYVILEDVASVGVMATISALGFVIFTIVVGAVSDRVSRASLLRIGGMLVALTFFFRIFATEAKAIYLVSFLAGLFTVLIDIPLLASFYDTANEEDSTEIVVLRELGLGIGRVASIIAILLVLNKFAVGFSLGGAASLIFSLF